MAYSLLPGYQEFFELIKSKIQFAQIKAALAVNIELITMYWDIRKMIMKKNSNVGWGNAIVEQLAKDLKHEFPTLKGFYRSNLFTVRQWYVFYSVADEKVQQLVGQIPWGHHAPLVSKVKNVEEAHFYMQKIIEHGWSRSILAHQIELNLYKRIGQATTNFTLTLPPVESDLAKQTLKDPYIFDFLSIGQIVSKRSTISAT